MTDIVTFTPQTSSLIQRLRWERLWVASAFLINLLIKQTDSSQLLIQMGCLVVIIALFWFFFSIADPTYDGWVYKNPESPTLTIHPTRIEYHTSSISRTLLFDKITSATFAYATPTQIGQIRLKHSNRTDTIQNWQDMNAVAQHIITYLPEEAEKINDVSTNKSSPKRAGVMVVSTLAFSILFSVSIGASIGPAWMFTMGVGYWIQRNVLPSRKTALMVKAGLWVGLLIGAVLIDHWILKLY